MFHNSTAIRPQTRGWQGDDLSAIDKDKTLTHNGGGGIGKGQLIQVNLIPSTLNPLQGVNGVYPHNSTVLQPISGPRTRLLWPGEDLSSINNGAGTRNSANNGGGGVADLLNPIQQLSLQEGEEGHQMKSLTFSLEELRLTRTESETLTHPNISGSDGNPLRLDLDLEGDGSPRPQGMKMVEGILQLPSKDICMDPEVGEIRLKVKYGTEEHIFKTDLHRFMHLLMIISLPPSSQGPPEIGTPSSQGTGSAEDISDLDSSPITSSSISDGSDDQLVPPGVELHRSLGSGTPTRNKENVTRNPVEKVKVKKVQGVPNNAKSTTRVKGEGWGHSCYFCTKRYPFPSLLSQHLVSHTMEKPFPCEKCTKRFAHNGDLTVHKRGHDLDPAIRRPFKCQECGKSFTRSHYLTSHVKIVHRGVKNVKCLKCDQIFSTKRNMMSHHDAMHLKIRHPCRKPNCGKTFSHKGALQRHQKRSHPKVQTIPE